MNTKFKPLIIFAAAVILIGLASILYTKLSDEITSDNLSNINNNTELATDFTVYDENNNPVKLSDYFGKPIVLNFWASWCPPCKAEMPTFNEIYKDKKDKIHFLMVDLTDGQRETVEKAKEYVDEQGFDFPILFDTDGKAANAYNIQSIPTSVFIDKNGKIVNTHIGMIDAITLQGEIAKIE